MNKKYTVGFYTLGCKVAQYETEALSEGFERAGFAVLPFRESCDFYVINTCTVTAESDRKSRQIIRRATKNNPRSHVLVCGCYSQRSPHRVSDIEGVSAVVGTDNKMSLISIALNIVKSMENGEKFDTVMGVTELSCAKFEPMSITKAPRTRAYVKICDGCDSRCTYCAIKEARGPIRSKPKDEVISEIEELYRNGTYEIVLTGIEIGEYGKDFREKYDLADLILELDSRKSCGRLRLGSLAPELLFGDFIDRIKNAKILCPHFHISIQSGSNKILALMKRRYNSNGALSVIEKLRENIKDAQFTSDIMVGFPNEGECEFEETLDFVRKARFLDAHVFCYSRREGTEAYGYENQVPEKEKEERSKRLRTLVSSIQSEILAEIIEKNQPIDALLEMVEKGQYTAHAPSYIELSVESDTECDLRGKLVKVLPVSQKDGILYCKTVKN